MDSKVKSALKSSLLVSIGLAIIAGLVWYTGPERLLTSLLSVSPSWVFFSMSVILLFYLTRAFRWTLLLRPVKNKISISNAFWITLIGYMANFLSGTRVGGEFLRAFLMRVKEDIGFFEGFSSICVERVLDLLGIVLIGVVSLMALPSDIPLPHWFSSSLQIVGAFVLVAIIGLIIGARKETVLLGLLNRTLKFFRLPERWSVRLMDFSKALILGAKGLSTAPRSFAIILVSTVIIWLLQALSIYAMFFAFGLKLSLGMVLLGSMVLQLTFIFPAPPGLAGTYEGAFVGIFAALGLGLEEVLPMSLLNHFLFLSLISLLGWIGMVRMDLSLQDIRDIRSHRGPPNDTN